MTSASEATDGVLRFWFDEVGEERWFAKDAKLDQALARRFGDLRDEVLASNAAGWRDDPDSLLAAIILLDQFSRNMFRGSRRAFEADPLALELARLALDRGWTGREPPERRQFFLMPFMHSEDSADQQRSVAEFASIGGPNLRFARLHQEQFARFGRFPGRNRALGRVSTPQEREVIAAGETF